MTSAPRRLYRKRSRPRAETLAPSALAEWARRYFRALCQAHGLSRIAAGQLIGSSVHYTRYGEWPHAASCLPPLLHALDRESRRRLPATRAECAGGIRPCPFVSCRHHLYLDVDEVRGSLKLNFPDLEVWEMPETCSLDAADREGMTLEEVGEAMNLSRERIRQVEVRGLKNLRAGATAALRDHRKR